MRALYSVFLFAMLCAACSPRHVTVKPCAENTQPAAQTSAETTDPGMTLLNGVEAFEASGIQVILKRTPGKPVTAAALYIKGGSWNLDATNAGVESMALDLVASGGSVSLPREEMKVALNLMGTNFAAFTQREYSGFALKTIAKNWDASFAIFEDVILHPAFPTDELELERTRQLEFLKGLTEDADRFVMVLAQDLLFAGHAFANRQWGTLEFVGSYSRETLVDYFTSLLTKERLLLVVVGDVTREDLEAKVAGGLGGLPTGTYQAPVAAPFSPAQPHALAAFEADTPTSYLVAMFKAPAPGDVDYPAMLVALELLKMRLFEKIRTKLDLSYAVSAGLAESPSNYGYLYLTSTYPSLALNQIFDEVETMQDWLVNGADLDRMRNEYLTKSTMGLQSQTAQREMLARYELLYGDWRLAGSSLSAVRAVTPADVRRVMQTYVSNLQLGYYGAASRLSEHLGQIDPAAADRVFMEALGFEGPKGH